MYKENEVNSADYFLRSNPYRELTVAELTTKICSLPELHRLVVALWYDEGLGCAQIAQVLNMPVGRVERLYVEAVNLLALPSLVTAA